MITEEAESIMMEIHHRLVKKKKHPNLHELIDYFYESIDTRFCNAETREEKDEIVLAHVQKFIDKAKELDVDDTDMFMAYIGIMKK